MASLKNCIETAQTVMQATLFSSRTPCLRASLLRFSDFKKMQFIAYMGAYKQNSFYLRQGIMREAKASFQENIISCLNIHTLLFIKLIPLFGVPKLWITTFELSILATWRKLHGRFHIIPWKHRYCMNRLGSVLPVPCCNLYNCLLVVRGSPLLSARSCGFQSLRLKTEEALRNALLSHLLEFH